MVIQPIQHVPTRPAQPSRIAIWAQNAGVFLAEYWALLLAVALGTIVTAAFSVPLLAYLGLVGISSFIFNALHFICAQIPSHSFHLLGHQLGMCARNISIYSSLFVGTVVFLLSKKRLPGLRWWVWLLLILPMALDGFSQMFGLRESTWELRVLTGTLFGLASIWFALPFLQKTFHEYLTVAA